MGELVFLLHTCENWSKFSDCQDKSEKCNNKNQRELRCRTSLRRMNSKCPLFLFQLGITKNKEALLFVDRRNEQKRWKSAFRKRAILQRKKSQKRKSLKTKSRIKKSLLRITRPLWKLLLET